MPRKNEVYERAKHAAVKALKRIDPTKPLGTELFVGIARVSITPCVEAVALRCRKGRLEVLLTRRSNDDPAYPGIWHSPGTAMRVGETVDSMFKRLSQREFWLGVKRYRFVGYDNNLHEERGHFIHLVYLVTLANGKGKGDWFPINALPPDTVEHHRTTVIPMAVKAFTHVA